MKRGFGTIDRRASGRYRARYTNDGKRITAEFNYKADAEAWLAIKHAEITKGEWIHPKAGMVLFSDYATQWLTSRSDLRETTRAKYELLLRVHLLPEFGHIQLVKVLPDHVRKWYHELVPIQPSTTNDAYRLLRAIFATAVSDDMLVRSPCRIKGAGSTQTSERPIASIPEVMAVAEAVPKRFKAAILLAAFCQLRRGEILGLQRQDIDMLRGVLHVRRAVVIPSGKSPIVGPPKTEAGIRSLSVPKPALEALEAHLRQFVGVSPEAWIFGTSTGTPISPITLERAWSKARQSISRPDLHLHDLRHSGLTWAAATGASIADLMHRGGHASTVAALRYQHATEDRDKALSQALEGLVEPVAKITMSRSGPKKG